MSGVAPDPLDRIAARASGYRDGILTFRCRDVLALVEVARAAREYLAYPTLAGRRQALDAALARLDKQAQP